MPKKPYTSTCNISYECNNAVGLICPTSIGTCNCPISSSNTFCDCMRIVNNEYYWNGSSCQASKAFSGSCTNSSTSYMCQTLTQGTVCNASNSSIFTCECPYLQYFDDSLNQCQNQRFYGQSCNYTNMCQTSLGFACISGICE